MDMKNETLKENISKSENADFSKLIQDNFIRQNKHLNKLTWCCTVVGPIIAIGVLTDIFPKIEIKSCIMVAIVVIFLAMIHTLIILKKPDSRVAPFLVFIGMMILMGVMATLHIGIHITLFFVPLLSLLYCDRLIYYLACAIDYIFILIVNYIIAGEMSSELINTSANTWYFGMVGGYTIELIVMMIVGAMFQNILLEYYKGTFEKALEASEANQRAVEIELDKRKALEESQELLEKALVRAEEANAAKTTFLFNMSHDIRTPMNAIIGFTYLLEKKETEKEKRDEYIAKIKGASKYLLELINNVLEMSRIESGKMTLNETVCNIAELVPDIEIIYEEQVKEKGIKVSVDVDIKHRSYLCDSTKIREIFLNIAGNAVKYTKDEGHIFITVKEEPCDKEGFILITTTVEDDGIGISEEFMPHIFETFTREKNSTESRIAGTGLGMPITKRLVDLMDGTISVTSTLGKGTKFTVSIPHKVVEINVEQKKELKATGDECFVDRRILLAEDNELNAEIAIELLEDIGIEVHRTMNGKDCLDKLIEADAGYYDMILMDVQMPVMNGFDATAAIRKLDDKTKARIPVVAMTANAFAEDRDKALECGMDEFIAKPIEIPRVLEVLSFFLMPDE